MVCLLLRLFQDKGRTVKKEEKGGDKMSNYRIFRITEEDRINKGAERHEGAVVVVTTCHHGCEENPSPIMMGRKRHVNWFAREYRNEKDEVVFADDLGDKEVGFCDETCGSESLGGFIYPLLTPERVEEIDQKLEEATREKTSPDELPLIGLAGLTGQLSQLAEKLGIPEAELVEVHRLAAESSLDVGRRPL